MLHKETVSPGTLELIRKLQADPFFGGFVLVGGTALALQLGHRISVDLDFFTKDDFDNLNLLEHLEQNYGFHELYQHTNTLKGIISDVLVDFITHKYRYVVEPERIDKILISSKEDIAAMKVNAITGNGTRIKDFIDIYFLLKEYSFAEIVGFYQTKYEIKSDFHAVKSLTYFDDINPVEWPVMILEKKLTLRKLKDNIKRHRNHFLTSQ